MAGLVQAVLTDRELALLLAWGTDWRRRPYSTTELALIEKLRGWQQSCDCKTD